MLYIVSSNEIELSPNSLFNQLEMLFLQRLQQREKTDIHDYHLINSCYFTRDFSPVISGGEEIKWMAACKQNFFRYHIRDIILSLLVYSHLTPLNKYTQQLLCDASPTFLMDGEVWKTIVNLRNSSVANMNCSNRYSS